MLLLMLCLVLCVGVVISLLLLLSLMLLLDVGVAAVAAVVAAVVVPFLFFVLLVYCSCCVHIQPHKPNTTNTIQPNRIQHIHAQCPFRFFIVRETLACNFYMCFWFSIVRGTLVQLLSLCMFFKIYGQKLRDRDAQHHRPSSKKAPRKNKTSQKRGNPGNEFDSCSTES